MSLNGGVREACLSSQPGHRCAPPRHGDPTVEAQVSRSPTPPTIARDVDDAGTWIIPIPTAPSSEPDSFATSERVHGLWRLDPQIAYLSGDDTHGQRRGWRVIERIGFSEKDLKRRLAELDSGTVEIIVRGVDLDPDRCVATRAQGVPIAGSRDHPHRQGRCDVRLRGRGTASLIFHAHSTFARTRTYLKSVFAFLDRLQV